MSKPLFLAVALVLLMCGCTRPPRNQVTMDIPPIVRAPDLLKKLALNVPKDVANITVTGPEDGALKISSTGGAPAFTFQPASEDDADRAEQCLTAAVYYEARSEPDDGKRAVAQVVLNRVRDRAFPSSVCGVVYQGSERRTGCQFSFTCDGSMNRRIEPEAWERAREIAAAALAGEVYAPVGSATFYHADYVSPWWAQSMNQVATIGAHIFYRWKNALERSLSFRQDYAGTEAIPSRTEPTSYVAGAAPSEQPASGIQRVAGVTIYRASAGTSLTAAAPEAKVVKAAATNVKTVRVSGGVRVHHGAFTPGVEGDEEPITVSADGAI